VKPPSQRKLQYLLILSLLFLPQVVCTQTVAAPSTDASRTHLRPIEPGPKPPDAPAEWKQLVGIYGSQTDFRILFETEGKLRWKPSEKAPDSVATWTKDGTLVVAPKRGATNIVFYPQRRADGSVSTLTSGKLALPRIDAGSDPSHFYHIKPSKPIAALRGEALAAKPPRETQDFRPPDLVELVRLDAAMHLDIRYAQSNNFLSTPIYTQARAFMQRAAAEALVRVSQKLRPLGYGLLVHDAYRPWYVTKMFWDATPPEGKQFVADPTKGSKHNRGCAVDLTLYDLATGRPAEMPGLYDEMSPRSFPTFSGGTSLQRWNRELLRRAMESEGFTVNESEWWHFDYRDWKHYQIMNVPFEDLGKPAH
jgi:D-alanyl-D-alanine dipeptidase